MDLVHESFLRWFHNQTYHERLENYAIYDSYYNGEHTIHIPPKVKAALETELGTVDNYCRIVVDSCVEYICNGEVGIEVKHDGSNQAEAGKAERLLYDVYESNGLLYEEMLKAITIMGKKGDVFLKLYIDGDQIKVRVLRPDIVFPRYKSDDYKEMLYCVVKWFSEDELTGERKWKAQVFKPDVIEYYELNGERSFFTISETQYSEWNLKKVEKNILGFIPIIHIKNTIDDFEFGISDLQVMIDLQDALNKVITDMLLTMDNQAFQRLVIFGCQSQKGQVINMEPGRVIEIPNENGRLEVVNAGDIGPFIQVMEKIVDQICNVTGIPRMVLSKAEGGPVSGYALRIHYIPLERKCRKKELILKNRFMELNKMILKAAKLLGKGDYTGFKTRVIYSGGLPIDEESQLRVNEMELRNGIKSRRTIMQERGIEDIEAEMAQIRSERDDI